MQVDQGDCRQPIQYEQYIKKVQKQVNLRKQNLQRQDQDQQFISSSNKTAAIKTIQKFISKFKTQSKNQESILVQMQTLNLSKYTDQIANIIVNSLTQKDIQFYTQVSTKLNKQYSNFPTIIINYLRKLFDVLWESPEDNRNRLKAVIMFTTELFVCGFGFSYKEIREMLIKIFRSGNKKRNNIVNQVQKKLFAFYYNSQCFVQFLVNYWEQFTKLTPKWVLNWKQKGLLVKDFPLTVPLTQRQQLTKFFLKYISQCQNVLIENIQLLKQYENQLKQNLRMEGEFNKENQKKYTSLISKFNVTKQNLKIICLATCETINEDKLSFRICDLSQIMKSYVNTDGDAQIFQNEFQKQIYQDLPEFGTMNKDEQKSGQSNEQLYKLFREKLQKCKNLTDSNVLSKQFSTINNKRNRKLLIKDILEYRKQYYLVTPYFCRIAAIVNQSFKDVGEMVNQSLFFEYEKQRENAGLAFLVTDKKNRNWKYLCEFTKFKIIDAEKIISCLHNLIEDLKGHNIELLIFALENVGRFLYLSSSTANKFTFLLNKLDNVLKQKSFPMLTTSRLINVMTMIKPVSETQVKIEKIISEEDKQALQILTYDVTQDLTEMLRKADKFIHRSPNHQQVFSRNLMEKILSYNFIGNYNYAYLLNQIGSPSVQDYIIKKTLSMLFQTLKAYQYQNSMILSRFIGELFKYELLKKSTLYQTLQELLKIKGNELGVINSVCTILETCVGYLDSKKILSQNTKFRFLYTFRKYIQQCHYVPMMQQFKITDIYQSQCQKYLCSTPLPLLQQFMLLTDTKKDKQFKQLNLSKEFNRYLQKKNLKQKQVEKVQEGKNQIEERKKQNQNFVDQDQEREVRNSIMVLKTEAKNFQAEFNHTLTTNIKDFSSRIAKTTFLEKKIQKRNEKKKTQNQKTITVIGRSGMRFIKRDVTVKSTVDPLLDPCEKQVKKD